MPYRDDLKALHILRHNIQDLLRRRHESMTTLATYVGYKHVAGLSKFLSAERGGFEMRRLDLVGEFFGLPVYRLFQPGISDVTERRHGKERRSGRDRRIGHQARLAAELADQIDFARPRPQEPLLP